MTKSFCFSGGKNCAFNEQAHAMTTTHAARTPMAPEGWGHLAAPSFCYQQGVEGKFSFEYSIARRSGGVSKCPSD
jgi:hypothetical protein